MYIVLHGFDLKIAQAQEKHHTANEDQQRAIADHVNQIQAIQHKKVTFQVEKDVSTRPATESSVWDTWPFTNRHVPRENDLGKDNIVMIIDKTPPRWVLWISLLYSEDT